MEQSLKEDLEYYRSNNLSFVEKMKENKNFQNPKLLQQTVEYFGIDGNGTQFDPVECRSLRQYRVCSTHKDITKKISYGLFVVIHAIKNATLHISVSNTDKIVTTED